MNYVKYLVFSTFISIFFLRAMEKDTQLPLVVHTQQGHVQESEEVQPTIKIADLSNVIRCNSGTSISFHASINLRTIFKDGLYHDVHDGVVSATYIANISDPTRSEYYCRAALKQQNEKNYDYWPLEQRTYQVLEGLLKKENDQKMKKKEKRKEIEKEETSMFGTAERSRIESALQEHFQKQEKCRIAYEKREAIRKKQEAQEKTVQETKK